MGGAYIYIYMCVPPPVFFLPSFPPYTHTHNHYPHVTTIATYIDSPHVLLSIPYRTHLQIEYIPPPHPSLDQ